MIQTLASADGVFRRCQRLSRGAVGLLLVSSGPREKAEMVARAVYVGEDGEVVASRDARMFVPTDLIVRERRVGAPFVAVRFETGVGGCPALTLEQLHFASDAGEELAPETLSKESLRPSSSSGESRSVDPLKWTGIDWRPDGHHVLRIRLPGMCTSVPQPYGGHSFEPSIGLEAAVSFDEDFRMMDRVDLRRSLTSACEEAGDLEHAPPERMFSAAFCTRLKGATLDAVRSGWTRRCDALARVEEAWGKKYWTSGARPYPAAALKERPPKPPRLCYRDRGRLWDADYTAQPHTTRPSVVMPDELADCSAA